MVGYDRSVALAAQGVFTKTIEMKMKTVTVNPMRSHQEVEHAT